MEANVHYARLSDVCRRLKSGEVSAVALTEHMLERIHALEDRLHSFAMVLDRDARATAERLDRERTSGRPLGPLHGVPVAVKDLLFTRGKATASGTVVMKDFVPDVDATVVARLKHAGAVIIGKTQLTEGAYGMHHPDVVQPVNPWVAGRWPGVSSSGSGVAVAAGLTFGALGTDTGGSIRFPSASCGVVGIKPTYGRVSRYGAFPLAESLDHIGPMARSVEDAARMLSVIAGEDANDSTSLTDAVPNYAAALSRDVPGFKVGVDWDYVQTGVEDAVIETVRHALEVFESLGAQIVEVTLPAGYRDLVAGWAVTTSVECVRAHEAYYPEHKSLYGPALAALLEFGRSVSDEQYQTMEKLRTAFRADLEALFGSMDVLIAPCMTSLPPTLDEVAATVNSDEARADFITFTAPFNYSGHPSITLPSGLGAEGLPRAFQLIGRLKAEPTLVRAGSAFEQAVAFEDHPID